MTKKQILVTAGIFGLLAVIAGAYGAHALKPYLAPKHLDIWQTAVQYQFYHTFALLFLTTLTGFKTKLVKHAYYLFTIGTILFSGSLYLVASNELIGWSWIPIIFYLTPLGGLMFIGGWGVLILTAYKIKVR